MAEMNTPWRVEADELNYEARGNLTSNTYIAGYNICTADGDEVVGCEGIIDPTSDRADFIVHCVNSHAYLVEENKRMREALNHLNGHLSLLIGNVRHAAKNDHRWEGMDEIIAKWRSEISEALGDTNA